MRSGLLGCVALVVAAACGTTQTSSDVGADAAHGTCCMRGTPTADMCGPVMVGGYSGPGIAGCKEASIPPCRHVHAGSDHGCPIWIDDGPCACDAGPTCPATESELPLDVTGYAATTMRPPRAPSPNACTVQQITDFAACYTGDTTQCAAFDPDASSCAACLVSQSGDSSWGPLVLTGSSPAWNVGGCVDVVLGQVASEPDSCGQKLRDAMGCADYACNACTLFTAAAQSCDELAWQSVCKAYSGASTSACAALADGGPPATSSCFPDTSITDPVQQQRDFVARLATFFCGPP